MLPTRFFDASAEAVARALIGGKCGFTAVCHELEMVGASAA